MNFISADLLNQWVNSPNAILLLSIFSFSESAFFIIPPEVLLIPMALAQPHLALLYGLLTTALSVAGAILGYWIGQKGGRPVLNKLFNESKIQTVENLFQRYDTGAIFISAFTPIPFKVFTIAAGVFRLNWSRFVLTSLVGRGTRYMIIAGLIYLFGDSIRYFLEHQLDQVILWGTIVLIALVGGYKIGWPFLERKLRVSPLEKIKLLWKKYRG